MQLSRFSDGDSWQENFAVYLFSELILKRKKQIDFNNYESFELTDKIVALFNDSIDKSNDAFDALKDFLLRNPNAEIVFSKDFGKKYRMKAVIWSDREKTPYYKEKLQQAVEFENFLKRLFKEKFDLDLGQYLTPEGQYEKGENDLGIEIKHDMMYKKTGNLYIEYAEKAKAENVKFIDSGIKKGDSSNYFLIGDFDRFWIFEKKRLLEILEEELKNRHDHVLSKKNIKFVGIATSLGFLFPIKDAEVEALDLNAIVAKLKSGE